VNKELIIKIERISNVFFIKFKLKNKARIIVMISNFIKILFREYYSPSIRVITVSNRSLGNAPDITSYSPVSLLMITFPGVPVIPNTSRPLLNFLATVISESPLSIQAFRAASAIHCCDALATNVAIVLSPEIRDSERIELYTSDHPRVAIHSKASAAS
jgi:hypothetical protein